MLVRDKLRRCAPASAWAFTLAVALAHAAPAAEWHVAPTGKSEHDGSSDHPWDLQTALNGAPVEEESRVGAGDTVWLHGGEYRGGFESRLAGTEEQPIIVRQARGERATIDCRPRDERDSGMFYVFGQHTVYWGFEVTCSDPKRETAIRGPWPEDIRRGGIDCRGAHNKFVNLVVHDSGGINLWAEGEGGEVYGCLIYHNGWKGPDRSHGHAVYSQNKDGVKRLVDNIVFEQFGYGLHCYGSEKAFLEGFHLEGNIGFHNGCLGNSGERAPDILVGGGAPVKRLTVKDNYTYGGGLRCGYPWGVMNEDATVTGNYIVGGLYVRDFPKLKVGYNVIVAADSIVWLEGSEGLDASACDWDDNLYFRTKKQYAALVLRIGEKTTSLEFDAWREATGFDKKSMYHEEREPKGVQVVVRPNAYEPGRANIVVFNWDAQDAVDVDLSKTLARGQRFRIVSAQNFFGEPLVAGTYDGETVQLPMRQVPTAQPVGMPDFKLPATLPRFGAFVVLTDE